MPNSNDVASEMLWERVLSLLVVGASVLGGSAGRRRFKLPISLATLEITPDSLRPVIHDLERD